MTKKKIEEVRKKLLELREDLLEKYGKTEIKRIKAEYLSDSDKMGEPSSFYRGRGQTLLNVITKLDKLTLELEEKRDKND